MPNLKYFPVYFTDKMIHVYGKYMDRSMVQFEAYRQVNGARIQEAQLALRLNNSRLLHARAYLRPDLMEDLQEMLHKDTGLMRALSEISSAVSEELRLKAAYLKRALSPVFDIAATVMEAIAEKVEIVAEAYRGMYRDNDVYLRDITDSISERVDTVK